jgi:hypothetical protein
MNSTIQHAWSDAWPDEAPTRPVPPISLRTVATLTRIDRLAELAAERLSPPENVDTATASLVLADLAQLRALAAEVLR